MFSYQQEDLHLPQSAKQKMFQEYYNIPVGFADWKLQDYLRQKSSSMKWAVLMNNLKTELLRPGMIFFYQIRNSKLEHKSPADRIRIPTILSHKLNIEFYFRNKKFQSVLHSHWEVLLKRAAMH